MESRNLIELANVRRARADEERARKNDDLIEPLRKRIAELEAELDEAKKTRKRGR